MGKINDCLKWDFIIFNLLFAIVGSLLVYVAVKDSTLSSLELGWVWAIAIVVLVTSCLGVYAGYTEQELALKMFAGFMVAGMIAVTIFGISMAFGRNKGTTGPNQIFAFAYGDDALLINDFNMKTVMGVLFGFAVTAMLGLLATTTMLNQVRRHDDDGGAAISTT